MANPLTYDDRLDHLLATAARVFAAKGYHCTAMRDLSRETGMSLAGMYHYVCGKDEMLYLVQLRCFTHVVRGAEEVLADLMEASPTHRLTAFIHHHVLFFAGHMAEMKVLSHEADALSDERITPINELKKRYVGMLVTLIRDAAPAAESDPNVAAYALFGMMNWIYNWYDPAGPVGPEALAQHFAQIFLAGAASPAHATIIQGA